jgi:hypothetical protein
MVIQNAIVSSSGLDAVGSGQREGVAWIARRSMWESVILIRRLCEVKGKAGRAGAARPVLQGGLFSRLAGFRFGARIVIACGAKRGGKPAGTLHDLGSTCSEVGLV